MKARKKKVGARSKNSDNARDPRARRLSAPARVTPKPEEEEEPASLKTGCFTGADVTRGGKPERLPSEVARDEFRGNVWSKLAVRVRGKKESDFAKFMLKDEEYHPHVERLEEMEDFDLRDQAISSLALLDNLEHVKGREHFCEHLVFGLWMIYGVADRRGLVK